MTIWIELISFHIALIALSAMVLIFISPSPMYAFAAGVLAVAALVSYSGKFYSVEKWRYADSAGASIVLSIGHIGTIFNVYLVYSMIKHGAGSGLFIVPGALWALVFYGVGVCKCTASLNR